METLRERDMERKREKCRKINEEKHGQEWVIIKGND